jgi:hypothetical protein
VNAISFIFIYEAIYKWSFYRAPFDPNHPMPPSEIREFAIQTAIAATVLTGFADGHFTLKKWTFFWLGLFMILWVFWLFVGFPQLTGEVIFPRIIPLDFTRDMTYLLSRGTKAALLLTYLTFFPRLFRKSAHYC